MCFLQNISILGPKIQGCPTIPSQFQCVGSMRSREDQRDVGAANLNRCGSKATTAGVLHMQLVQGDKDIDAVQVHFGRAWNVGQSCSGRRHQWSNIPDLTLNLSLTIYLSLSPNFTSIQIQRVFLFSKQCIYIHTYIHTCIHAYIHTYITLHYIHYTTLHYITLRYITYITLHYTTLHHITLHYITLHCITLHYITYIHTYMFSRSALQLRLSHTSAAAHPEVVDYFNFRARTSMSEKGRENGSVWKCCQLAPYTRNRMEWARRDPSIEGDEKTIHDNHDDFVGGVK